MAASHCSVVTGGNSLNMRALLHYLDEVAERRFVGCFRMHKKYSRTARSFARRLVDDFKSLRAEVIISLLRVFHAEGQVRQSAAPAVLFDLLRHRRLGS